MGGDQRPHRKGVVAYECDYIAVGLRFVMELEVDAFDHGVLKAQESAQPERLS